jgi:phosphate uptake regulator
VARNLRLIVGAIQAAEKIERTGDLAPHVAALTRRRHPACAVPADLAARFGEMARLAVASVRRVQDSVAAPPEEHFTEQDAAAISSSATLARRSSVRPAEFGVLQVCPTAPTGP